MTRLTSLRVNPETAEKERVEKHSDLRRWMTPNKKEPWEKPLPQLLQHIKGLIEARAIPDWAGVAFHACRAVDSWAALTEQERSDLSAALPNSPPFLGEWATLSWVAYICSLVAVPKRRDCLVGALADSVAKGGPGKLTEDDWLNHCGVPF